MRRVVVRCCVSFCRPTTSNQIGFSRGKNFGRYPRYLRSSVPALIEKDACEKALSRLTASPRSRGIKRARLVTMVMLWRLIVAVAALARSDARRDGLPRHKLDAVTSALAKGDYSVLDVDIIRGVLDGGWDVNKRMGEFGPTILHITAKHGDPKVVQLLVEYGAHVNIQESDGVTPCATP